MPRDRTHGNQVTVLLFFAHGLVEARHLAVVRLERGRVPLLVRAFVRVARVVDQPLVGVQGSVSPHLGDGPKWLTKHPCEQLRVPPWLLLACCRYWVPS